MPRRSPRSRYQRLALGFLGFVVLLAIGVLLLSIARVEVKITPRREPIIADFDVTIIASGPATEREILGRLVRIEGTAEEVVAPADVPAVVRGVPALTVTLVNTQAVPQPLITKTRLLSPEGVQFRMVRGVTVPAKGRLPNVEVVYDTTHAQPENVNLGTEEPRKYRIPGLSTWLQERVWGESSGAMQPVEGGTPELPRVPVGEVEARRRAADDARARLAALTRDGEESVVLASNNAVTPSRGTVRVVETITAILIPKGAITDRAQSALEAAAAGSGRTLLRMRADKLRTRLVSQDPALARATIAVHAEGDAVLKSGSFTFEPRRVAGFTAEEVATYLQSIPGVGSVEVQLRPFWVKRVPSNIGSVEVEVIAPE